MKPKHNEKHHSFTTPYPISQGEKYTFFNLPVSIDENDFKKLLVMTELVEESRQYGTLPTLHGGKIQPHEVLCILLDEYLAGIIESETGNLNALIESHKIVPFKRSSH